MSRDPSILLVSIATTAGWRVNERELSGSLARLGVHHRTVRLELGPERHLRRAGLWPLTDAVEAVGMRRELERGVREARPTGVIFLSTTAALLAPITRLLAEGIRSAVRVDVPSASSRPGAQNAAQRILERRRLREAKLVMATGPRSAALLSPLADHVAVVPVPVAGAGDLPSHVAFDVDPNYSGQRRTQRAEAPRDVLTYAADPDNKGLDLICEAWWALPDLTRGRRLHVTGVSPERGRRHLLRRGVAEPPELVWHGEVPHAEHLALLESAAAYVSASAWEGAGIAQLEALAAGVPLATTPSRGAYEAFTPAAALAPELATGSRDAASLAGALRAALAMDAGARRDYAARAAASVHGFTREESDRALRDDVLPLLA